MKLNRRFLAAAFTLAEVMVAIGLFGITAAAAVEALVRMNVNAALCRLQTGASTLAQNQIDLILSDAPFNPQYSQIPPELTVGTTYDRLFSTAPTHHCRLHRSPESRAVKKSSAGWHHGRRRCTGSKENGNTILASIR